MAKNTINQTQLKNNDGWQLCPQTPTYVDASTISFTGTTIDSTLSVGMKLKLTNNSAIKYYTIVTLITAGSDRGMVLSGSVALANSAITNVYFSTEKTPYGLPGFNQDIFTARQNDTTNVSASSCRMESGIGRIEGNGTNQLTETVTFGTAFKSHPIIIAQFMGYLTPSGTYNPTGVANDWGGMAMCATKPSTSGFTVIARRFDGNIASAGTDYYYSWIAIGN